MKSDATSVPERPPVPREKQSLNPWLLVCGTCLGFLMLVVVGLSLLALFAPKQSLRANERLMPDGTVLRIEGVTWGTTHNLNFEHSTSGPWAFWDRRNTPLRHGTGQAELRIWMSRRDPRSGRMLDFEWWAGSTAVDSLGEELSDQSPMQWELGSRGTSGGGGNRPFRADRSLYHAWVVSSSLPAFRTDHGRFQWRVKNIAGEVVATFELTHPSPPLAQNWSPEELPVTKTNGDVSVALTRLNANSHWGTNNGMKHKWWYYSPTATVSENGQLSNDWSVNLMEITDPLGNHQLNGEPLSVREPAWKVRLGAFRRESSRFSAAETWSLPDIPLPEKDKTAALVDSRNIDGATVTLAALAGSGKTSYSIATPGLSRYGNYSSSTGGSAFGSSMKIETKTTGLTGTINVEASWPHLTLETVNLTALQRLYLLAKDDQGRHVPTQQSYHHGALQSFFFKIEPDAKSLTLTVIVHKGREFEFFIQPPEHPDDKPIQ